MDFTSKAIFEQRLKNIYKWENITPILVTIFLVFSACEFFFTLGTFGMFILQFYRVAFIFGCWIFYIRFSHLKTEVENEVDYIDAKEREAQNDFDKQYKDLADLRISTVIAKEKMSLRHHIMMVIDKSSDYNSRCNFDEDNEFNYDITTYVFSSRKSAIAFAYRCAKESEPAINYQESGTYVFSEGVIIYKFMEDLKDNKIFDIQEFIKTNVQ